MAESGKNAYVLDLSAPEFAAGHHRADTLSNAAIRPVASTDAEALAELMLEANRDTMDYEGEEIEEAREVIADFFSNAPLLDASMIAFVNGAASRQSWSCRCIQLRSFHTSSPTRTTSETASPTRSSPPLAKGSSTRDRTRSASPSPTATSRQKHSSASSEQCSCNRDRRIRLALRSPNETTTAGDLCSSCLWSCPNSRYATRAPALAHFAHT